MATARRKAGRETGGAAVRHGILVLLMAWGVCAGGILAAQADSNPMVIDRIAPTFANGLIVETKGQSTADAVRVWRKAAWQQDDLLAQIRLGEIYSDQNKYRDYYDPVESYVWYFMASRADQHYYSDDSYVNQKIGAYITDAKKARRYLYERLNTEQRMQARDRIIYILGSRSGEGFVSLAQLHQLIPAPAPPPEMTCVYNPSWYRRFINWFYDDPPRYPGDYDWEYTQNLKDNQNAEQDSLCEGRPLPSEPPPPKKASRQYYQPEATVLIRSNEDALMYLFVADGIGHPLAGAYIESLEYAMSNNGKRNIDAAIDQAKRRARLFALPFEFYLGATVGDTPHSDERLYGYYDLEALGRCNEIPPDAFERALSFRGYLRLAHGRHAPPPEFVKAVVDFQKAMRFPPTGILTPEQAVRLIQIAALYGDAGSQNRLGVMYAKGVGVPRNFPRAEYWFMTAGKQLHGEALFNLSVLYRKGVLGVPQNEDKADRYAAAAARNGYRPLKNELFEWLAKAGDDGQD